MEAIGSCRVSTAEQAQEGISLAAQQARIAAWCTAHGYELVACLKDAGLSGSRADNRPALQNALMQTCQNKAALVVYSLSQLARSTTDAIKIIERLNKEVARAVANPKIAQQINNLDADPVSNRPDQFQAFIKSEIDKWSKVIRAANIKIE